MSTPAPSDWNKTVDDLLAEVSQGKRRQLSTQEDEFQWAIDYERSLLPSTTVFPRGGQVWEAVCDCEVRFLGFLNGRVPTSGMARLPHGERVRIFSDDFPKAIHWTFRPLRYDELHESIVPEVIRSAPGYQGYLLDVRVGRFNENFRLVEDVA